MEFLASGLLVALAVAAVDMVWAKYLTAVAEKRPTESGSWAAGLAVTNVAVVLCCVHDIRFVGFAGVGAFVGTYVAVRYL